MHLAVGAADQCRVPHRGDRRRRFVAALAKANALGDHALDAAVELGCPRIEGVERELVDQAQDLVRLLAFDGDRAVGWCELAPRADLAWLARARYLGPVDDLPVWSVPCFYVRSSHRGRGVMDALIEAALPTAASAGAPALEAYPVDTTVPSHTGNLFPGIAAAFARHGFEVVARRKPDRPVMRKLLGDVRNFST